MLVIGSKRNVTRGPSKAVKGRTSLLKEANVKMVSTQEPARITPVHLKGRPCCLDSMSHQPPACIHPCNSFQLLPIHSRSCLSQHSSSTSDMKGNVCNRQSSAGSSVRYSRRIILLDPKCIFIGILKLHGRVLARVPKVGSTTGPALAGK
jgi:hypothetical protein